MVHEFFFKLPDPIIPDPVDPDPDPEPKPPIITPVEGGNDIPFYLWLTVIIIAILYHFDK